MMFYGMFTLRELCPPRVQREVSICLVGSIIIILDSILGPERVERSWQIFNNINIIIRFMLHIGNRINIMLSVITISINNQTQNSGSHFFCLQDTGMGLRYSRLEIIGAPGWDLMVKFLFLMNFISNWDKIIWKMKRLSYFWNLKYFWCCCVSSGTAPL